MTLQSERKATAGFDIGRDTRRQSLSVARKVHEIVGDECRLKSLESRCDAVSLMGARWPIPRNDLGSVDIVGAGHVL